MIRPIAQNDIAFRGKKHKTAFAEKMKNNFSRKMEEKYNVDSYESLDKESKNSIKKDYTVEVGTCALATAALSVVCYSKSRNALKGSVDALSTSIKRMAGKTSGLSDEAQGIGSWLSEKVSTFLNKNALKQKAAEVNSSVKTIVERERNASINQSKTAERILENITGNDKMLFRCSTGRNIAHEEVAGIVTSLQEIGQSDLAVNLYNKSKNGLSGEDGTKVLTKVADTVRENTRSSKTFNSTKAGILSFADEVETMGNKKLAGALRGLIPENAGEAEIISVPFEKFNETVANSAVTVFRKNEPVAFDTQSRLHGVISKALKDESAVKTFEEKLGQKGIANGNDLAEAGLSLAIGGIGGKEVLEAVDAVTDVNDSEIGEAAMAKQRILSAKQNHAKITSDDAFKLAKAAANLVMAG